MSLLSAVNGSVVLNRIAVPIASLLRRALPQSGKTPKPHPHDRQSGRGTPSVPASDDARSSGHETEDMDGALMGRLAIGLGLVAAVVVGLMLLANMLFRHADQAGQPALTAEQTARVEPPAPRLQVDGSRDLAALRATEDGLLQHYAWITPDHRRARIPINRAKTLMIGKPLDVAP